VLEAGDRGGAAVAGRALRLRLLLRRLGKETEAALADGVHVERADDLAVLVDVAVAQNPALDPM
jgi:hypothetical protein